jgi:hypothetical protein
MKIETSELTGMALDWAVAKCQSLNVEIDQVIILENGDYYVPTEDWAQGGPIIEHEGMQIWKGQEWCAAFGNSINTPDFFCGSSPLIAAMRCYVANKLGHEVDIPKEIA